MLKLSLRFGLSFALALTTLSTWNGASLAANSSPLDDQDLLLKIASPLQDEAFSAVFGSAETSLDSGFAGVSISSVRNAVDLYWKGMLSHQAKDLISTSPGDVTINIHSTPYSLADEVGEIEKIASIPEAKTGLNGAVLAPSQQGLGLEINLPATDLSAEATSNTVSFLSQVTAMDFSLNKQVRQGLMTSRTSDSSPYSGGAYIFTPTTYCSSGFNVQSKTSGATYALTAQHCFHDYYVKKSSDVPVYNGYSQGYARQVGTWQSTGGYNDLNYDAALFRPTPTSTIPYIYIGSPASDSTLKISSVFNPVQGQTVCTDGARSGEHCNIVVDQIYYTWTGSYDDGASFKFTNMIYGHQANSGIAVSSGDSGGPVYDYQNGGYAAVGIISGAFIQMKSCTIAGETCYSDVVFSSVYRDLNSLNMEITK